MKLRAAVGCNLDFHMQETEITIKGIRLKKEDDIKTVIETK